MEAENSQNRKRTRDDDHEYDNIEIRKGKKHETVDDFDSLLYDEKGSFEFCDGMGSVFDFPWLKEGVVFKTDEYFDDNEDTFATTCSCLDEISGTTFADESCVENSVIPLFTDHNYDEKKLGDDDDDGFFKLQVDHLEPIDCIWNSVLDEPLDVGLNKA